MLKRFVRQESRALLVLRRNLWRMENPDGGFMPMRFCEMPGRRYAGKRAIRTLESFKPLEIGHYEGFRFVQTSSFNDKQA